MDRIHEIRRKYRKKIKVVRGEDYLGLEFNSRLELIRQLIPLGLMKVQEELQEEVRQVAGERYSRGSYSRYGKNPGSVVLGGQRVAVDVPRVRDARRGVEVPMESYRRLHEGLPMEEAALRRILKGVSCRDYSEAALAVPEAFGLSASNVSRQFIEASKKKLKELNERKLSAYDFVAMFLDGKSFSGDDLIVGVGVTVEGEKVMLGFIEAATENERVAGDYLNGLLDRGMNIEAGILVVVDGSKGLISAVRKVFKDRVLIQRCQWHKRENVVDYISKADQPFLRRQLQRAYERPIYNEARKELMAIRKNLEDRNLSAAASLDEGFEETLTLHRLGLFGLLGRSFKTVNCIESVNAVVEQRCGKVDYWKNSSQRQRWLASALLDIEPRLSRIRGWRHLNKLRLALKKELNLDQDILKEAA